MISIPLMNITLFFVGIAVASAGMLGFSIFFSDEKSATSKAFIVFAGLNIVWGITNFVISVTSDPNILIWWIRANMFLASWHAFSFLVLSWQFPERQFVVKKKFFYLGLLWTTVISLTTLTPLVFKGVSVVNSTPTTIPGPGIVFFGITAFCFVGFSIGIFLKKMLKSSGFERQQRNFVFIGMVTTFVLILSFNFIFPAFLNISALVPLGGMFELPYMLGVAYAILRYRLFNLKVATVSAVTFLLATATFFDVLLSSTPTFIVYRIAELVLVLVAGIWLIKSMVHEFELERELSETNARQETLMRFVGHEVKGFLTKDMGVLASLFEGDFGALPDSIKSFVEKALAESRKGAESVSNILKASNLKKGKVSYTKEPFDLKALVADAVERVKHTAEQKGLALSFTADDSSYQMTGDKAEIGDHVLRNLIDNAINYTQSGSIVVSLKKEQNKLIFAVKDTGIGITEEDKKNLFTEGGHGKDSQKINVHSTGYGLYIAKQIVEAHGGAIRAVSDGEGKGSTFVVEFSME